MGSRSCLTVVIPCVFAEQIADNACSPTLDLGKHGFALPVERTRQGIPFALVAEVTRETAFTVRSARQFGTHILASITGPIAAQITGNRTRIFVEIERKRFERKFARPAGGRERTLEVYAAASGHGTGGQAKQQQQRDRCRFEKMFHSEFW